MSQADTHPPPEELELLAEPELEPHTLTGLTAWALDIVQTHEGGGFVAGCSCGWRSIAYPLKASAEAAMAAHAKAIPGRRREETDTLVRRNTSQAPIMRRFFARTFRRPRQHRRARPSGVRGSPDSSPSASPDDDPEAAGRAVARRIAAEVFGDPA